MADPEDESRDGEANGMDLAHPGWQRGIRIGSTRDGFVTAFIPDPETDQDNSGTSGAEGVAVDAEGNVYGGEVSQRRVVKHMRMHPVMVPQRGPGS